MTEYRLTFTTVAPQFAAGVRNEVWPTLSDEEWEALPWKAPTVVIRDNPWDQYNNLKKWAETHEQPIRDVKLEQRERPDPESGWSSVGRKGR